jgi:hypothetical protein
MQAYGFLLMGWDTKETAAILPRFGFHPQIEAGQTFLSQKRSDDK